MGLFDRKPLTILTMLLDPEQITLSWLEQKVWLKRTYHPYQLNAYQSIPLINNEFHQASIFNFNDMLHHLSEFINGHAIVKPSIALGVSGPAILETMGRASPPDSVCDKTKTSWQIHHVGMRSGTLDEIQYACSISAPHLLQYQILSKVAQAPLLHVTTQSLALMRAFDYRKGSVSNGIAQEKSSLHTYLDAGIKTYDITHHVKIPQHIAIDTTKDHNHLITSFGLHLLGKETHEQKN